MGAMRLRPFIVLWPLLVAAGAARADQPLPLGPGSRVRIDGDSSVTRYSLDAEHPAVTVPDVSAQMTAGELHLLDLTGLRAELAVESLRSATPLLEGRVRRALDSAAHPTLTLVVSAVRVVSTSSQSARLQATVELTLKGVKKSLPWELDATPGPNGLRLAGDLPVKLSDFSVEPPVVLGFIHASNDVRVHVDLRLPAAALAAR